MTPAETHPTAPDDRTGANTGNHHCRGTGPGRRRGTRPGGERPPPEPWGGGGPGRGTGGLAAGHAPRRPLPRRPHARQRARVHLLARGGGPGRRSGGRGQSDTSRRRVGTRPLACREPVPHHGLDIPAAGGGLPHRRGARRGRAQQRAGARGGHHGRAGHLGAVRVGHAGGGGRRVGDARDARLSPLHIGDLGRAEGLPVQPGPAGPHRGDRGADVRARAGGRLLSLHAAVPLQRADGWLGPGADGGLGRRAPLIGALLRLGLPPGCAQGRCDLLQLRGKAAVLHSGHARATRRCRQPAGARLRQRGDHR